MKPKKWGYYTLILAAILLTGCAANTNTDKKATIHTMEHNKSADESVLHHQVGDHSSHSAMQDEHAEHRAMLDQKNNKKANRVIQTYELEGLPLVRMDDREILLEKELSLDKPIVLNFIFTSCTTICPVLSATFSEFQQKLGDEAKQIKMISISIDPEYDTPKKLREYASKFNAGSQWQFYTGTMAQSISAQRAFDSFRGGKMNHIPLTFLRRPGDNRWLRIEGFTSSSELLDEYRQLLKQHNMPDKT